MDYGDFLERIGALFLALAGNSGFVEAYPWCLDAARTLESARSGGMTDLLEAAVIRFYCLLHASDVHYSPDELARLHGTGGYWCYAGGLEPLFRAGPFISEECRSADLGAGNGLQGLLLQHLYPHRVTTQVELSATMIRRGERLRQWMGLPGERFQWVHGDIGGVSPECFDFIYMYLPVRPEGSGATFYRSLARKLESVRHGLVLFSVADCFRDFAPATLRPFHSDGHLTCYSNRAVAERAD